MKIIAKTATIARMLERNLFKNSLTVVTPMGLGNSQLLPVQEVVAGAVDALQHKLPSEHPNSPVGGLLLGHTDPETHSPEQVSAWTLLQIPKNKNEKKTKLPKNNIFLFIPFLKIFNSYHSPACNALRSNAGRHAIRNFRIAMQASFSAILILIYEYLPTGRQAYECYEKKLITLNYSFSLN